MIKAGSLFYALIISLLISIISSSLILFAYLTTIQFDNFEISHRLKLNVDSGLNLLLSNQTLISANEEKTLDLYGQGTDSVFLKRKYWGGYEIIISKALFKNIQEIRIAQIGIGVDTSTSYCIYLSDNDKPLAVCGKTVIKGNVFLPKSGIKSTFIEGQNYSGSKLVDGIIKQSKKELPKIHPGRIEYLDNYLNGKFKSDVDSVINIGLNLSGDSINNSFINKTIVFETGSSVNISNGSYSGNIIIYSSKQIVVSNSAIINNCILIAPKIIIEKQFKGTLQAFASDSIILKEEVCLNFPSCIGIIQLYKHNIVSGIKLSENDTLHGNIFAIKKIKDSDSQIGVMISKKSNVTGVVYSEGFVDLKGSIYGTLICNKIMLNTPSSIYDNHLLNAELDGSKLSEHFVGIDLLEESKNRKIAKWLN